MKKLVLPIIAGLFIAFAWEIPEATAAKTTGSITTQTKAATSTKPRKKYKRKFKKYVAPSKEDLQIESIPLSLRISDEVAVAVARNDIDDAIRLIRTEPPSSRALTFLKSMESIEDFKKDKKAPKVERNLFYRNLGISYHNLFLFLQRKKMENPDLYKNAIKYYKRSLKTLSPSEKTDGWILIAEIKAQNGKTDEAKKIFEKLDLETVNDSAHSLENVAAFYAAIGEKEMAIDTLKRAIALDPEGITIWLSIGDDFLSIENEPEFKELKKR